MPEFLGDALFELRANVAPLRASMAEAEGITMGSVRRMETGLSGGLGRISSRMSSIGHSMTRGLTLPIVGIGAAAAKMAIDFQKAMENIHTQAGASQREVDILSTKVLALAKTVPFGPTPLADALYHLESIGLRLNKTYEQYGLRIREQIPLMQVLKVAAEGAAVGHANLEETTTALGSAWLSGIRGAQNLGTTMGTLNAIVGTGNMRMQDLVTSLGTGVLPMAKLAGLSLNDVGAALAIFSDEGYKSYSAATQMATALHYLYDPTKKATDALAGIHIGQTQLAEDMHKPHGLLVALTDLKDHLDKLPGGIHGVKAEAVIGDIFPAGRGRVLSVLMNQLDNYSSKLGQITKNQKKFQEDVGATQKTLSYQVNQAWAIIQSDLTNFGEKIAPVAVKALRDISTEVNKVFDAFGKLSPSTQKAILEGGLIVAAVGPAMRVASFFLGGMGMFVKGIGKAWDLVTLAGRAATGGGVRGGGSSVVAEMRVAQMTVANMTGAPPIRGGAPVETIPGRGGVTGTVSAPLGGEPVSVPAGKPHFRPTAAQFYPVEEPVYVPSRMRYPTSAGKSPMMTPASLPPLASAETDASVASGFAKAGGMALRAAGVAGLVAMFAPAGAVLGKALFRWLNGPEPKSLGDKFSEQFTASLGTHVTDKFQKPIAKARDDLQAATQAPYGPYGPQISGARQAFGQAMAHGRTGGGPLQGDPRQTFGAGDPTQPTAAQQRAIEAAGYKLGQLSGKATIAGLKSVKDPNQNILLRDFTTQLAKLPAQARPEAAKVMIQYANELHRQGKLPASAMNFVIKGIMAQFPGLTTFMTRQGLSSDKALAATFKFNQSQGQLKSTLSTIRSRFGDLAIDPNVTGKNLNKNVTQAMSDLQLIVNTSTGKTKRDALAQMKALRDGVTDYFDQMAKKVGQSTGSMKDLVAAGSKQAYQIGAKNWQAFSAEIAKAMASGTISVSTGASVIAKGLNATLKAFGEAPLGIATIKGMTPAQLEAVASGQVSSGAAASPHAKGGMVGAGGLMTVGNEGERGSDVVPLQMLVGRGEKVAVFNAQQQAVMDHHLSRYGGLQGMFANVNQPHYATPRFGGGGFVPRWQRFAGGGLAEMVKTANAIDAKHYPYLLGGGHNPGFTGPYDCSGAVSAVLHSANLLGTPLASAELSTSFLPGPGVVTIYAHGPDGPTGHAYMSIGGRFFGTSNSNPGGGAGWFDGSARPGFAQRHVLADMGFIQTPKIEGKGTIPTAARAAMRILTKAANARIKKALPTGPQVGDGGDAGTGNTGGGISARTWRVKPSQEASASGTGWTELSTNGNAAAITGNPHTATHQSGWDFASLGRTYPSGTMLNIKSDSTGQSGTWPRTDIGDGSSYGPAIGLTPAVTDALGGLPTYVDISMADGSLIELAKGFGSPVGNPSPAGGPKSARQLGLHSRGGFARMARGGFATGGTRQRGSATGTGRPGHRRHSVVSPSTGRQLGVLSKAGAKVNALEQDIATWTARFNSMSGRFSTDEAQLQFLAEDGSLNAAGITKKTQDDQALYIIAYRLWQDYQHEIGPVSAELRKWLGVRSHTQKEIDNLNKTLTANKIKEVNLERARQALSKPAKRDEVLALKTAIKKVKDYWDPRVRKDEGAVKAFHPRPVPALYTGSNKTRRAQNRAARAAAIKWNTDRRNTLQGQLGADRLRERGALAPLNSALTAESLKNRARKDKVQKLRYGYNRDLSGLRAKDTTMRNRVKTLKGILAGEPGATGDVEVDKSISLLEGVADKLGTVVWDKSGKFMRIDTTQQGAAYDQRTQVESLGTAVGQDKLLTVTPADAAIDNSVMAGYYQDLANQNALKFAISQAQYAALAGMPNYPGFGGRPGGMPGTLPPYAGAFATGGIVPGPLGAPRTAIVHGGEIIKPADVNNSVKVSLEDYRTRVQVDDVEHVMDMVNRRMTRSVARRLPGNGGGIVR